MLGVAIMVAAVLAAAPAAGELRPLLESQITVSSANETTPTLGNDGVSDLVVYTVRAILPDGSDGPGDIWFQRLTPMGEPTGPAWQITADPTDDELNDVSGDYIVYTAYDSLTSMSGKIMVYRLSDYKLFPLAQVEIAREPRIHGNNVVWAEGPTTSSSIKWYDLRWLGDSTKEARDVAGPYPPTSQVAIGSRYIVWTQIHNYDTPDMQAEIWAFDMVNDRRMQITRTADIDETDPATSGDWITWQKQVQGAASTSIEAMNPYTYEVRTIVSNGAYNLRPSIDGDLVAWESTVTGNYDVFVHRLSDSQTFRVTTDPADQYLNDVFGNKIAYVDLRNGTKDIYVTRLDHPPVADAGPERSAYVGRAILLEGSATDDDGDPIHSWSWSVTQTPQGATFDLQDADKPTASFQGNVPGDYTLGLKVCTRFPLSYGNPGYIDSCSVDDYVTIRVAANLPPTAAATATPTTLYVGGQVCFDGSASSDPENGPLAYVWDFGDGTEGSSVVAPCHTYSGAGTFTVRLIVADEAGATDEERLSIAVRTPNSPPTVSPTATPNTGAAPLTVQFAANAADAEADPLAYLWNFGDGTTGTEPSPVHQYTAPGTYTVSLTVSDGQASTSASLTIAVSPTIQLSVRTASVKWWNRHKTMGMVHVWADLTAPVPLGTEVVQVTFDGIRLLSEPFSAFRHEPWTDSYVLAKRGLVARLDFTRGRLFVLTPKIDLIGLDNSNGVDVTVSVGPATAVENITMNEAPGDRLIYRRAGATDEP
jgi:beta propeller repeat protein